MTRLLRRAATLPIVLTCAFAACSSRDVVVFEVEPQDTLPSADASTDAAVADASDAAPGDAGMDAMDPDAAPDASDAEVPILCKDLFDCPPYGYYCVKDSCSDPTGVCEPRPVVCPTDVGPVCGCNGVTYWNDCLRQQLGSAASTPGECQSTAIPCNRGGDCGFPGARCARLLFPDQQCPPRDSEPGPGTCWAIPPDCNQVPYEQRWRHCPLPDEPEGYVPMCVNTCWAIWSEWVHLQEPVEACD